MVIIQGWSLDWVGHHAGFGCTVFFCALKNENKKERKKEIICMSLCVKIT